jgi:hypothetical protein
MIEELKFKLLSVTHSFASSIICSQTKELLLSSSMTAIQQISSLIMPKIRIDYLDLEKDMPQDTL